MIPRGPILHLIHLLAYSNSAFIPDLPRLP